MSKCKDCHDTRIYQPLTGSPEPCLACCDPPVFAASPAALAVEQARANKDWIQFRHNREGDKEADSNINLQSQVSKKDKIKVRVAWANAEINKLQEEIIASMIGTDSQGTAVLKVANNYSKVAKCKLNQVLKQIERLET